MKYTIRPDYSITWFKRRHPTRAIATAIRVELTGFEKINNHPCDMVAHYDDDTEFALGARVHHNTIKDTWSVQGLDAKGHSVVLDIIEF